MIRVAAGDIRRVGRHRSPHGQHLHVPEGEGRRGVLVQHLQNSTIGGSTQHDLPLSTGFTIGIGGSRQFGDRKLCNEYAKGMIELANEYRSLLSAKKKS